PTLGRWLQRDPITYIDGMSLYEYVAASPATNLDPFGLYIEIDEYRYFSATDKSWKMFSQAVEKTFKALCPCVAYEMKQERINDPDRKYNTTTVTAKRLPELKEDKKSFCKCVCEHVAGCTLLHGLLTWKERTRLQYTKRKTGEAAEGKRKPGEGPNELARYDLRIKYVYWNPDFPGWKSEDQRVAVLRNEDKRWREAYVSLRAEDAWVLTFCVLVHELRHAWDFWELPAEHKRAEEKVPPGWPSTEQSWWREIQAVRLENQVYKEIMEARGKKDLPRKWGRLRYAKEGVLFGIPAPMRKVFEHDRAACDKLWEDFPWGGAWH
ncbi:MAG: hypothetical protein WBF17_23345, partial [Phycisphaerae bacterium]